MRDDDSNASKINQSINKKDSKPGFGINQGQPVHSKRRKWDLNWARLNGNCPEGVYCENLTENMCEYYHPQWHKQGQRGEKDQEDSISGFKQKSIGAMDKQVKQKVEGPDEYAVQQFDEGQRVSENSSSGWGEVWIQEQTRMEEKQ